ncbi:hypothetical protein LCGC14_3097670, partial [marine sediment metagenome]
IRFQHHMSVVPESTWLWDTLFFDQIELTTLDHPVVASERFADLQLGPEWVTYISDPDQAQIWLDDKGMVDGSSALKMGGRFAEPLTQAEAIWSVNLSGVPTAMLNFELGSSGRGTAFDGDFVGHFDGDGIAISTDGEHWRPVFNTPKHGQQLSPYSVSLDDLPHGSEFYVKFQRCGTSYTAQTLTWDDLSITRPSEDWYAFSADAGTWVSILLAADQVASLDLRLYDDANGLLAKTTLDSDGSAAIDQVFLPTEGTYYIRVASHDSGDYALSVATGAAFEPHAGGAPRELAVVDDALGHADAEPDDYRVDVITGDDLIATATMPFAGGYTQGGLQLEIIDPDGIQV